MNPFIAIIKSKFSRLLYFAHRDQIFREFIRYKIDLTEKKEKRTSKRYFCNLTLPENCSTGLTAVFNNKKKGPNLDHITNDVTKSVKFSYPANEIVI